MDLYAIMRLPVELLSIPLPFFTATFSKYLEKLKVMEKAGQLKLQEELHTFTLEEMIQHGIKYLGSFHAVWPLKFGHHDDIVARNPMLVYYYHNRLTGFHLEDSITWDMESVLQAQTRLQQTEE